MEYASGKRSVLWKEEKPNSPLSNPPYCLYKADEHNVATDAYIMKFSDEECDLLKNYFLDVECDIKIDKNKVQPGIPLEEREYREIDYSGRTYDDVVDNDLLMQFEQWNGGEEEAVQEIVTEKIVQRFNVSDQTRR